MEKLFALLLQWQYTAFMKSSKKTKSLREHMATIATKGGEATKKKHGRKHYVAMARARWKNKKN